MLNITIEIRLWNITRTFPFPSIAYFINLIKTSDNPRTLFFYPFGILRNKYSKSCTK